MNRLIVLLFKIILGKLKYVPFFSPQLKVNLTLILPFGVFPFSPQNNSIIGFNETWIPVFPLAQFRPHPNFTLTPISP